MIRLADLPDDDTFRVIKWIDRFTPAHLATRSANVQLRLQRLPFQSHAQLNRLTLAEALVLLSRRRSDAGEVHSTATVHAGLMPHLQIGRVYQGQRHVGELPTHAATLVLPDADLSGREVCLGEQLPRPAGWSYPYSLIHTSEYDGIQHEFAASRCLVYDDPSGVEYIIPRALIFKRFYALHRELANAFTSGPWAITRTQVVCEKDFASGLKTEVDPTTGHWHVVLATKVPDDYARLAALLYFDDHARACAEAIYAKMLEDRRGGGSTAPWFAAARLPFRSDINPLRLEVRGFPLRPRTGPGAGKPQVFKRAFLVTAIPGCSWPAYIPTICKGRENDGSQSETPELAEGPKPWRNAPSARPAASDLVTTSAVDPSAMQADAVSMEDTQYWLGAPPVLDLNKQSSKRYAPTPALPDADPGSASAGQRTYQASAAAPADPRILVRDPVNAFRYLLEAFEALQRSGHLQRFSVFQPADPTQAARCGGVVCWNFLDARARNTGRWPKSGWRMLERARGTGQHRSLGKPRSVLVVAVEFDGHTGHWFEIESRPAGDGSRSPLIVDTQGDPQEAVQHIVESIARAQGRNLPDAMDQALQALGSGQAHCWTHQYEGGQDSRLDLNSLRRLLGRFMRPPAP